MTCRSSTPSSSTERRRQRIVQGGLAILVAGSLTWSVAAVRVIPNRFDLAQVPGSEETYTLRLESDRAEAEEVKLYLGEWLRSRDGEHDWGVPSQGARWVFDRSFAAGETVVIRYRVAAADGLPVTGSFQTGAPQIAGLISGATTLSAEAVAEAPSGAHVTIVRSIEGDEVTLTIRTAIDVQGLSVMEIVDGPVTLESVFDGGAEFDAVARSCTSWVRLSQDRVTLAPGEARDIAVTVSTPASFEGAYWTALFVESQPEIVEQAGTRILTIPRAAIKLFVTAPGSELLEGEVTGLSVSSLKPLALVTAFENTGNVELTVQGDLEVVDRTGMIVRRYVIADFKVLPGAARDVLCGDSDESAVLPSGVYQAVVRLDFGGDGPVAGVRAFRIP